MYIIDMVGIKLRIIREKNRFLRLLLQMLWHFQGRDVSRVLLFHDIKQTKEEVKNKFELSVTSFEKYIVQAVDKGARPMDFVELQEVILRGKYTSENQFVVTFDDINESVYTRAYPILKKYQIPFIVFVTMDLIDKPGFISRVHLLEMANDPLCVIGSHGMEHKIFRYMNTEAALYQYQESKQQLEQLTGRKVECFAFPYGRVVEVSRKNIRMLRQSGIYQFGFSALDGTLRQQWLTSRYYLPRIIISEQSL